MKVRTKIAAGRRCQGQAETRGIGRCAGVGVAGLRELGQRGVQQPYLRPELQALGGEPACLRSIGNGDEEAVPVLGLLVRPLEVEDRGAEGHTPPECRALHSRLVVPAALGLVVAPTQRPASSFMSR